MSTSQLDKFLYVSRNNTNFCVMEIRQTLKADLKKFFCYLFSSLSLLFFGGVKVGGEMVIISVNDTFTVITVETFNRDINKHGSIIFCLGTIK